MTHTSREFEKELRTLRERLLEMSGRAEQQIQRAVTALVRSSDALAQEVIDRDVEVDKDERDIDEMAFLILARRQPVASDLRFVMVSLKIVTDLERIGDLAVNIAKRALTLNRHPPEAVYARVAELAEKVEAELRAALDAFVHADAAAAEVVIAGDCEIDRLNTEVIGVALTATSDDPSDVGRWLALSSVSRYLERIGDHATNIAEMVVYYVKGRDIRHST